jgi:hypothetical protein
MSTMSCTNITDMLPPGLSSQPVVCGIWRRHPPECLPLTAPPTSFRQVWRDASGVQHPHCANQLFPTEALKTVIYSQSASNSVSGCRSLSRSIRWECPQANSVLSRAQNTSSLEPKRQNASRGGNYTQGKNLSPLQLGRSAGLTSGILESTKEPLKGRVLPTTTRKQFSTSYAVGSSDGPRRIS